MRRRPFPSPLMIWLKRQRRDRTAPTVSAAIDAAGTTLTLTFSESVTGVSAADFALSTGQALSNAEGAGTTWTLTTAQVYDDETPTLVYSGTAVEDAAGNALAAFSGAAITNNSTVTETGTLQVGLAESFDFEDTPGYLAGSHAAVALTAGGGAAQTAAAGGMPASGKGLALASASSQYATCADNATLSMGSGVSWTISFWVKFTTVGGYTFVHKGDNTSNGDEYLIRCLSTQLFVTVTNSATQATLTATVNWATGTWYHVVAVFDDAANTITAWVNNSQAGTPQAATGFSQNGGNSFNIGRRSTGTGYLNGVIDSVQIWKRALTSAERAYLYNSGAGRTYAEIRTASPA
jgi:putative flippase GtrA